MRSEIKVRRAEKRDIPRVLELLTQVCMVHHNGRPDIFKADSQKYHAEELELLFEDETRPVFVGVDEHDRVLGYGFCVLVDYSGSNVQVERTELYLDDLCVDESARGKGVGSVIFDYIRSYAKEIGCYHLTLNVWACNPGAMAFYESKGMEMLKKEMEIVL
ncbi:MAG: GNAT family N-acetyltransferase [Lachnospiraceae bacterium]|nr:GNAT family N-acetyltransferase [Lachnospiraceae bacterium]